MRCGIAIFSIGTMIYRALRIIQMVEIYFSEGHILEDCQLTFLITMISKITSLLFIFIQTFFIFKYANIIINYGKNVAVFGLIHIVVTNLCVTMRIIVSETMAEIHHHYHSISHNKSNLRKLYFSGWTLGERDN